MKHNILVTGGNGFIGSQVVTSLVEAGHKVTIVDLVGLGVQDAKIGNWFYKKILSLK